MDDCYAMHYINVGPLVQCSVDRKLTYIHARKKLCPHNLNGNLFTHQMIMMMWNGELC